MSMTVSIKVLGTITIRPMEPEDKNLVQGLFPRIHSLTITEDAEGKIWWIASGSRRGLPEEEWQEQIAARNVIELGRS